MWFLWTCFVCLFVLIVLGYLEKKHKKAGVYTQPGICYDLKRILAWAHFRFVAARREVRVHSTDVLTPSDHVTNGFVPRPEDVEAEHCKPLNNAEASDSLSVYGCDASGRSLLLQMARRPGRQASLVLLLNIGNESYQLPGAPDTTVYNTGFGWRASGLVLECVVPMRLWRISYHGQLRRCSTAAEAGDGVATCTGDLVSAKLSFLWRPLSAPVDLRSCDTSLLVKAVARELWTPDFLSLMTSFSLDGYLQFGCLHGRVSVGEGPAVEVRLRGPRLHRWGGPSPLRPHRRHRGLRLQARLTDGSMLYIRADSWREGITHLVYGVYVPPSLDVLVLSDCSLSLPDLAEQQDVPAAFNIQFTAGGKTHAAAFIAKGPTRTVFWGRPWRWMTMLQPSRVCLDDTEGSGIAEFGYPYQGACPVKAELSLPLLVSSPLPATVAPSTLTLEDPACRCEALVGGKATSLALMTASQPADATVPPAVVVTAAGWRRHLRRHPAIQNAIEDVAGVAAGTQEGDLRHVCSRAEEEIRSTPVSEELTAELEKLLRQQFGDVSELRVAVRSSALGEDGEEMSAAGQNETVLGCRGLVQVKVGVARCWASLFSHHSVEYRRQRGQHVRSAMAVVVQQMVTAEVSGVMFTRDPATGDPSHLTLAASYGLGESVVSSKVEPDSIMISRSYDDQLSICERQIGSKSLKIVMKEGGGTEEMDTAEGSSEEGCLSDEMALRLARLGLQLDMAFGGARDVEWAVAEGRVFLLQSRPVTTDAGWTEFELTHETDTALLTDHLECFTTANTGEVLPVAVSPLTQSLEFHSFSLGMARFRVFLCGSGLTSPSPAYASQLFSVSHGRCMMNFISLMLSALQTEAPHPSERAQELTVAGHLLDVQKERDTALRRHGTLNTYASLHLMTALPRLLWGVTGVAESMQALYGTFVLPLDHLYTAQQTLRFICSHLPDLRRIIGCEGHIFITSTGNALQTLMLTLLNDGGQNEWDERLLADFALLLSNCKGAESAGVPAALKNLSELIAAAEDGHQFASASPEEALKWLKNSNGFVSATFKEFIEKHGHRGPLELELSALPWALDPAPVVATLQTMVKSANPIQDKQPHVDEGDPVSQLHVPLSGTSKRLLRWLLPLARRSVVLREQTKSLLVRVIHQIRLALRHLGSLMVQEGRLPDAELVFFLGLYELQLLLDTRSPAILAKAVRRRRLQPVLEQMQFPEMIHGVPRPLTKPAATSGTSVGDLVVRGTPVCQGRVQATARVVTSLSDAAQIQRDDILVTRGTDIGWSPYFPLLSGVVTELGGLISHGAVVAREYGLPCVVGAAAATHLLRSGDRVELDGSLGTITRLRPQE